MSTHLVIEKKVLAEINGDHEAVVFLFATVFNVKYTEGCTSFYLLLEALFFKKKISGRKPRLQTLLAELL